MSSIEMSLLDCTRVLLEEVADGATQKDVASTYGMAILSAARDRDNPDWGAINRAIVARWNMAALDRIKRDAMKLARGTSP